ncbi:PilX N-terminal domain-containing pilus assembly protein [Halomonas sp. PR-M31]|uniref:pilus assembly PilX family protein n=1 Tax=Halomonas sp. PR-M31 TaxID=1471202 RepID=UPI000651C011|nr:PilX N-terminal domain-containing pilus assembly protein [Halomonas sp. PR-M31]
MPLNAKAQQGAALLVVLVMLVIVGLIAVTGAQDSQLQAKMSVNSRAYEKAYYRAETALAVTEQRLQAGDWQLSAFNGNDGLFVVDQSTSSLISAVNSAKPIDELQAILKKNGKAVLDSDNNVIGFCLIEYLGRIGGASLNFDNEKSNGDWRINAFRVTALGQAGANNKAWAVVQSELRLEPF